MPQIGTKLGEPLQHIKPTQNKPPRAENEPKQQTQKQKPKQQKHKTGRTSQTATGTQGGDTGGAGSIPPYFFITSKEYCVG